MKKSIAIFLALVTVLSATFVACSSKNETNQNNASESTTSPDGLEANADNYVLDTVEVTDKDGKTVTDKNGKAVTTDVAYKQVTDKKGNEYLVQIDDNGKDVTDTKGKPVTLPTTTTKKSNSKDKNNNSDPTKTPPAPSTSTTKNTTVPTAPVDNAKPTQKDWTTLKPQSDKVPSTSASGEKVKFSQEDANIVATMLSVPYLYNSSYENNKGVPTNIAAHAAMWMAERENLNTSIFASGTIVLDLFKFFGQTVVNFKTKCNEERSKDNYNLKYSSSNDTFIITKFESPTHSVSNLQFYNLGNNNYYKVEASVSGCKYSKVTAVIQKNKLDSTLGFSIKALKWS